MKIKTKWTKSWPYRKGHFPSSLYTRMLTTALFFIARKCSVPHRLAFFCILPSSPFILVNSVNFTRKTIKIHVGNPEAQPKKKRSWAFLKLKTPALQKTLLRKWKGKAQTGRRYLQNTHPVIDLHPKYMNESYNLTVMKLKNSIKNRQRIWIDIWL